MRNEPCSKCGAFDYYTKGDFSYCRPCHTEAQKRYIARKQLGEEVSVLQPPNITLSSMSIRALPMLCSRGHFISGSNVRISSQRKGKNLKRRCRACERDAKRIRYGLAPEPDSVKLSDLLDS